MGVDKPQGPGLVLDAVADRGDASPLAGAMAGAMGGLARLFMPSPTGGAPTYKVLQTRPRNRRTGGRARTRLATGKLFDSARRFVAECHICDVSDDGFRIRAPRGAALATVAGLYEDATGRIHSLAYIWAENGFAGFRTVAREIDEAADSKLRQRFSGPYYALD